MNADRAMPGTGPANADRAMPGTGPANADRAMPGTGLARALYDAPGPRTRRRTLVASATAAALLVVGGYLLVYLPLQRNAQFTTQKWAPLLDPGNELFPQVWTRLRIGFTGTLVAAGCAIASSMLAGTALAVLRVQTRAVRRRRFTGLGAPLGYPLRGLTWLANAVTRLFVEVFRGMPVVITILFVWFAFREYGLRLDLLWYLVIGLSIYNSVVIAEILRSGMEGLPGGQREAAESLGLSAFQTIRLVLLPQSLRIMLPALISQLVVVLKDTSLGFIISYDDVLKISTEMVQVLRNPLQVYAVVGSLFVAINYSLSTVARYAERRLARRGTPILGGTVSGPPRWRATRGPRSPVSGPGR